jgi:FkbH-like protein
MEERVLEVALAATFTPDLVKPAIEHWLGELGIAHRVTLGAYAQLFQDLLRPDGLFARTRGGAGVLLVRLGDWARGVRGGRAEVEAALRRGAMDFISFTSAHARREGACPLLVCLCPEPRGSLDDLARATLLVELERLIKSSLGSTPGLLLVSAHELLSAYPVVDYDDPHGDELGHIPFTPVFSTVIGTVIARKLRALTASPPKVVAVDCDNTLWNGVVGEDGVSGIGIDEGRRDIQRFLIEQHEAGVLLCLCSKNNPADVDEVFRSREMPLGRGHILSSRIGWAPKSESLLSLASELGLGLSSFVLVDDSRLECAEIEARCPEVLTLELPADSLEAARFLRRVWAFDRWSVTAEDRRRSELYRDNLLREQSRKAAPTLAEFLAGLDLHVAIEPARAEEIPRLSQLTFRTNQLNFTTIRRSEAELRELCDKGALECLAVSAKDRFGDHGLVGAIFFTRAERMLILDTFLLSCRVLGRGVEHRMLAKLGAIAEERGLASVALRLIETPKNQPAQELLRGVAGEALETLEKGYRALIPAAALAALTFRPEEAKPSAASDAPAPLPSPAVEPQPRHHALLARIARELTTAEQLHARVCPPRPRRPRPEHAPKPLLPRDELERQVAALCEEVLDVGPIGVLDDLFLDFGADSLAGLRIAARIRAELKRSVQTVTVLEARTVARLAEALRAQPEESPATEPTPAPSERPLASKTIYALRREGKRRPFFLVRPASNTGGSLSYLALTRQLDATRPIYVFQNRPLLDGSELYPSVEAMAAEYLRAMREVEPRGPYLLGGWCLGGKVAFEMASELMRSGGEVGRLLLFDTTPPSTLSEQVRFKAKQQWNRLGLGLLSKYPALSSALPWAPPAGRTGSPMQRFQSLSYWDKDGDPVALVEYAFPGRFDAAALRRMRRDEVWRHVYAVLRRESPETMGNEEEDPLAIRRGFQALAWDHELDASYAPRSPYPGEVHFFGALDSGKRVAGWQRLCERPLVVQEFDIRATVRIRDPHNAMMQEENVALFAPAVDRLLNLVDDRGEQVSSRVPSASGSRPRAGTRDPR